jgi:hypothetical protein
MQVFLYRIGATYSAISFLTIIFAGQWEVLPEVMWEINLKCGYF